MFGAVLLGLSRSISGGCRRDSAPHTRVYEPINLRDNFLTGKREDEIEAVLFKIRKIYRNLRLSEELLDYGFCFGIVDPARNILINSGITKGMGISPLMGNDEEARDLARRSLDGLIAFLTRLFPYLPNAEALRFLALADAHPLVASCLIISSRMMLNFDYNSNTTADAVEAALLCAAVAAKHPDPAELVRRWKPVSIDLEYIIGHQTKVREPANLILRTLKKSQSYGHQAIPHFDLRLSWLIARRKMIRSHPGNVELPPSRGAIKRMLLATIHGFYLQVLARLPTADPSRYYRSMLMGGHCYGPLDPVSNIIINTIWYELNFPESNTTLHMISTDSLWRTVSRSLYGLISFLCTRYPCLTPELAMVRLLLAEANLSAADPKLHDMQLNIAIGLFPGDGPIQESAVEASTPPSTSAKEAYAVAAIAASHPNPAAQQEFLASSDSLTKLKVAFDRVLKDVDRALSVEELDHLMFLFKHDVSSDQRQQEPERLSKRMHTYTLKCKSTFLSKQKRVRRMVEAALSAYNHVQQLQVKPYVLHVICGVNEFVSGPEFCLDKKNKEYNPWSPYKFHHSHINFLATQCVGAPATLFFAECSNDDAQRSWCVPVSLQHPNKGKIRCLYCERECDRILHPAMTPFHGGGHRGEFAQMLSGEPPIGTIKNSYTNDSIIRMRMAIVDRVCDVEDDSIYSTYAYDESDGEEEHWLSDIEIC